METGLIYTLNIPTSDAQFFMSLVKKMGWSAKKQAPAKTTRLAKAIKAAHEEELFETNDINELMKMLEE